MNFTEDQLAVWAVSPSESERQRMENAERAVREAICASEKLNRRSIRVFAQGSYRNRVNVRQDSDVDVAVLCTDTFFWDGPPEATHESLGLSDSTYDYAEFRKEVGEALRNYFASGVVTEGDKAFDIKANSYRVDADVAPFFEHKRFDGNGDHISGVELHPKSGGRVINWPDQHYANAVEKNDLTKRSFKGCVRILKAMRYRMISDEVQSAKDAESFLVECLVWNVPNDFVLLDTWSEAVRECLAYLFNNTMNVANCGEWGEVSELKYLFRGGQHWTMESAHRFISDCWDYMGFE